MSHPAIIFDLDGTLIDTAPDLHASLNYVLGQMGRSAVSLAQIRSMVGDGVQKLIERGLEATGGPVDPGTLKAAVSEYFAHYAVHLCDQSLPFPGVEATLKDLLRRGHLLAVCTNKPYDFSMSLLRALGLNNYFGAVVGGDSLPMRKPDAGHLLGTLAAIGGTKEKAIMVGDSRNDVAVARNADVPVIAVSFGYTMTPPHELGADRLIDFYHELPAAIESLNTRPQPSAT